MFEASLFESEGRIRAKNGCGIAIAAVVQGIALSGLLLAPLFSPARLPQRVLLMTLTAPPPPPIPMLQLPTHLPVTTASALQAITQALVAPSTISRIRIDDPREPDPDASVGDQSVMNSAPDSTGSGVGNLLDKLGGGTSSTVRPASTAARGPVRISSGVMQGQLDSPILPVYPSMARAAHMQGTVIVAAIVSRTGAIEKVQVLSGPMMLRQAASTQFNARTTDHSN